ncbi:MAG: ABC transporter ATP-binding protein [Armatimonadetes bacterium]|nr:ABC transporter ATP-binding protein [Armatimonadota bacterium]
MPLLEVDNLCVEIGGTPILRGVTLSVDAGETLGIVGESGCGKSMTGLAVMGMLPPGGKVVGGSIKLNGRDIAHLPPREWQKIRGQEIGLVMQDPFTSLNPLMRVGEQIAEVLQIHKGVAKAEALTQAVEMLRTVGVPSPEASARKYPHQMSGGQRQRVVIATAFIARPKLLIADEPTTALDVTLQAQILRLLEQLQKEERTAVAVISHDIGVIGSVADRVAVFYAGRVVESGPVEEVLRRPRHPYTKALLEAIPTPGRDRLATVSGQPPLLGDLPAGCPFAPRCPDRHDRCDQEPGSFPNGAAEVACWLAESGSIAAKP